jgi:eukaryotic-like serine/threonine-protein kinase
VTLSAGTRLGPYEILSPLGAGGMGEVYKSRDIRLDRFVALKVLPAEVASDPDRLRRFEQEARAASALNHPNILSVYDVGSRDTISYIVTELVEGKTLRDVLLSGPLPLKKLLDLAVQIAEGLASAHEAGIVHRDLKPANIMISKDGFAKILDFGLARIPAAPGGLGPDADTEASTETASETGPGAIVGTVSYMSPEQASGKRIDFRSDQFSFGSVLYEMATGRRAFPHGNNIDALSAILHNDPEPRPGVLPPLRWIIERCLCKAPADRYLSTGDLARDLRSLRDHVDEITGERRPDTAAAPGRRRRLARAAAAVATLVLTGLLALSVYQGKSGSSSKRLLRVSVMPPPGSVLNVNGSSPAPVAVSPDGRRLVFGSRDASGVDLLWSRSIDSHTAEALAGTEGATYPFWSPDGRFIAFFAKGKLKRIPASGGSAQTVCEARDGRGGSWSPDGAILFAPDSAGPIYEVSDSGGDPRPVTAEALPRTEFSHRWPSLLPDGSHFLYLVRYPGRISTSEGIYVGSRRSTERRLLLHDISNAAYSAPGFLLFVREGILMGAAFDADRLRLTGGPLPLGEQIGYHTYRWNGAFSVSATGVLAYQGGDIETARLAWFERTSRRSDPVGAVGDYGGIRLSPDGRYCAAELRDPATGAIDIWVYEFARGVANRLTSGSTCVSPVWSPDGRRIVYSSNRSGHWDLYQKSPASASVEEMLYETQTDKTPTHWSDDGKLVLFNNAGTALKHRWEIWQLSASSHTATPYLRTAFDERDGTLSPDGRFLAYVADESGRQEVYVQSFPDGSEKRRVSTSGGWQPLWRRDGSELYYVAPDNKLMAVKIRESPALEIGEPETLFEAPFHSSASEVPRYAPSADGQKFLLVTESPSGGRLSPITLVINWPMVLGR